MRSLPPHPTFIDVKQAEAAIRRMVKAADDPKVIAFPVHRAVYGRKGSVNKMAVNKIGALANQGSREPVPTENLPHAGNSR